jgi:hypothetical protein
MLSRSHGELECAAACLKSTPISESNIKQAAPPSEHWQCVRGQADTSATQSRSQFQVEGRPARSNGSLATWPGPPSRSARPAGGRRPLRLEAAVLKNRLLCTAYCVPRQFLRVTQAGRLPAWQRPQAGSAARPGPPPPVPGQGPRGPGAPGLQRKPRPRRTASGGQFKLHRRLPVGRPESLSTGLPG